MAATLAAPPAPPARLWTRNFGLYFTARTVAVLGDTMIPVATTVAMLALGFGVGAVGVALGAWMGAFALFVVFGGVFADRFHPRPQMIAADALRCAVQAGLAVCLWLGHPPLGLLVAGSVLGGLATAMFQPGLTSLVPQVAADPQQANGVLRVSQGVATMAGPAIAGTLVAAVSPASVFAATAATFVLSGLCLAALRLPSIEPDRTASTLQNLREGWTAFRSRSWLWSVILIWWVLGVSVWGPITPVGAVSIIGAHGKAAFGWAESSFGVGCVLGGLVAIRLRPARPLFGGALAMLLFPLMPLSAALVPAVPLLMLGYLISGIGWAFWGVQWATSVQTQIPADKLNRVAAYEIAGSILAVPLGQAVAGPASDLVGVHRLLFLGAAVSLGCVLALLAVRPVRRLPRVDG
ncbi:MFS transporter [Streptomyces sp. CBMA123]|uniref:MFS transporter n=1 Tax=Streptomyces sp. CBMA123 TaxID=1896313 RepID=UPI001661E3E1|nr:MFS transporter [Streptomyces sp. CBMA123]MBD0691928.1 MFS transporter [Streptomyces sp. CBMA123]